MEADNPLHYVQEILVKAGLKVTQQRLCIFDALKKSKMHPTAENLYDLVKPENPSISLGTVYKTLDRFLKTGLVKKVLTEDELVRYDANLESHSHIYCTNTGEIIDFHDQHLKSMIFEFIDNNMFANLRIMDITLQINGEKIDTNKEVSLTNIITNKSDL